MNCVKKLLFWHYFWNNETVIKSNTTTRKHIMHTMRENQFDFDVRSDSNRLYGVITAIYVDVGRKPIIGIGLAVVEIDVKLSVGSSKLITVG